MSEKQTTDQDTPEVETDAKERKQSEEKKTQDPAKVWTTVVLAFCIAVFVWHIFSDKYTPYSAEGRIQAFVVPITPQVSGTLDIVSVSNNQIIAAGQTLAVIDPIKYKLNVQRARADLRQASQTSAADVNAVTTAQAKVSESKANLQNAQIKGERIIKLSKVGAASMSRADDARTNIEGNKARLMRAQSELEKAKSKLGLTGEDNARIKSALFALEAAELDLSRTTLFAPSDGVITNLLVDVGHFANAGAPIMTFISTKDIWVQANMRENNLGHIKSGDPVEMVLDSAPGRIINGEVISVGYAVSDNSKDSIGGLTTVRTSKGWLRDSQYFPVFIRFVDDGAVGFRRKGGQVNVIVYTGDRPVLNTLGFIWIRLISFLSHIY
jgi:multidrug resistance efflux pump